MAIARWTPIDELTNLHTAMDRLFSDLFEPADRAQGGGQPMARRLAVDVEQTDSGYRITAPIPGFRPEEIDVTVAEGILRISATHREQKEDRNKNFVRREIVSGNFVRQLALPPDADPNGIDASFQDGMLAVELPRMKRPEPTRVQVKSKEKEKEKEKAMSSSGSSTGSSKER
jgi:HSP20 family protein